MSLCTIEDCKERARGKGYCLLHYTRWKRHGDPLIVKQSCAVSVDAAARINAKSAREGECIVYTAGNPQRGGYGQIHVDGRMRAAHRVAWELANGPIPEGMVVCHRCDNPPCIRLDHLFLGTMADNNRDRDEKGRDRPPRGSKNGNAKLTEYQVAEIKVHIGAGQSTYALAARYGVSQGVIWGIRAGRGWKHVKPASWLAHLPTGRELHARPLLHPLSKVCEICQVEFTPPLVNRVRTRTCSPECLRTLRSQIARARWAKAKGATTS